MKFLKIYKGLWGIHKTSNGWLVQLNEGGNIANCSFKFGGTENFFYIYLFGYSKVFL